MAIIMDRYHSGDIAEGTGATDPVAGYFLLEYTEASIPRIFKKLFFLICMFELYVSFSGFMTIQQSVAIKASNIHTLFRICCVWFIKLFLAVKTNLN